MRTLRRQQTTQKTNRFEAIVIFIGHVQHKFIADLRRCHTGNGLDGNATIAFAVVVGHQIVTVLYLFDWDDLNQTTNTQTETRTQLCLWSAWRVSALCLVDWSAHNMSNTQTHNKPWWRNQKMPRPQAWACSCLCDTRRFRCIRKSNVYRACWAFSGRCDFQPDTDDRPSPLWPSSHRANMRENSKCKKGNNAKKHRTFVDMNDGIVSVLLMPTRVQHTRSLAKNSITRWKQGNQNSTDAITFSPARDRQLICLVEPRTATIFKNATEIANYGSVSRSVTAHLFLACESRSVCRVPNFHTWARLAGRIRALMTVIEYLIVSWLNSFSHLRGVLLVIVFCSSLNFCAMLQTPDAFTDSFSVALHLSSCLLVVIRKKFSAVRVRRFESFDFKQFLLKLKHNATYAQNSNCQQTKRHSLSSRHHGFTQWLIHSCFICTLISLIEKIVQRM